MHYLSATHLVVRERNPAGRADVFWSVTVTSGARSRRRLPGGSAGVTPVEATSNYFRASSEKAHTGLSAGSVNGTKPGGNDQR